MRLKRIIGWIERKRISEERFKIAKCGWKETTT